MRVNLIYKIQIMRAVMNNAINRETATSMLKVLESNAFPFLSFKDTFTYNGITVDKEVYNERLNEYRKIFGDASKFEVLIKEHNRRQ